MTNPSLSAVPDVTILSYGMGVESTILLRWILEPETRPVT